MHSLGIRGKPALGIFRNAERGRLFFYANVTIARVCITKGDTFIIGPDDEIQHLFFPFGL